jgi:hypothetical protein
MMGCLCQLALLVLQYPGLAGATSPRPALAPTLPCTPHPPTCAPLPVPHHCRELEKESIVVFDEAHNIDNVCIEALSVSMRKQTLEAAGANINKLSDVRGAAAHHTRRCLDLLHPQLPVHACPLTAASATDSADADACPGTAQGVPVHAPPPKAHL